MEGKSTQPPVCPRGSSSPLPRRDTPSPRLVQLGGKGVAEQDGRPRCDPYPRKAADMGGSQPHSPLVFGMVSQRLDHQVDLTSSTRKTPGSRVLGHVPVRHRCLASAALFGPWAAFDQSRCVSGCVGKCQVSADAVIGAAQSDDRTQSRAVAGNGPPCSSCCPWLVGAAVSVSSMVSSWFFVVV